MKRFCAGYTLVEVLVAAAILMVAVAAAAALSLASSTQEESNARIARCLNLQEQAVRLYQLGVTNSIPGILPPDPAVVSLTFTTNSLVITNLGTVEQATVELVYTTTPSTATWTAGTWSSGESSTTARRTNTMIAIRPSIR